jgi:Putative Zn-dependent protease, contains TPR repeats
MMNSIEHMDQLLDRLMKDPDNPLLLNEIGVLLYHMKDWNNAEQYFRRAFELSPADEDVLYNYGSFLYFTARWDEAASIFKEYLTLRPDDSEIAHKYGDSCYLAGSYQSAAAIFEKLPEKKEDGINDLYKKIESLLDHQK